MSDSEYHNCSYCDWTWKKCESPQDRFKIEVSSPPHYFCGAWCKEEFKKDFGQYYGIEK
jgi:YHS domain-containing protein